MNREWDRARGRYNEIEPPEELGFAVASAIREGDRRRKGRGRIFRSLSGAVAACACFVVLVNASPAFASALADVPVLGALARVVTVTSYSVTDRDHLIDVRLPAVEDTGHTDLEQRINTEIQTRIQAILDDAETRAQEAKAAYIATGGEEEDFIPIIIDVDYQIKCQNGHYLSFVVQTSETQASVYQELFPYTIDLEAGKELTLQDVLGPDYKDIANTAIRAAIAERSQDPHNSYFDGTEGVEGFQSVTADQKFYLNEDGNPVVLFQKYEIAPGYMGVQEFEIAQ